MACSPDEIKHIAQEAGRAGAHEALEALGLDLSTPDARAIVRRDFEYMRDSRIGSEVTRKIVKRTVIVAFVGGILYVMLAGAIDAVMSFNPFK